MSDEKINSIKTSDYGLTPYLDYYDTNKIRVKFNGGCLLQDRSTLLHGGIINVYIISETTDNFNVRSYPTLENWLFRAVKLTKNADIVKYGYSYYEIGFDRHGFFFAPFWRNWQKCNNFWIGYEKKTFYFLLKVLHQN